MADAHAAPDSTAGNRARQVQLYGASLGDLVRGLTTGLGISQARLSRVLGLSPAMLSQLVSGHRIKIGDPAVLARLRVLDQQCAGLPCRPEPDVVDALLADVARVEWHWTGGSARGPELRVRPPSAAEVLRGVTDPARLAAAAATLNPSFPELAEVLWQAAARTWG